MNRTEIENFVAGELDALNKIDCHRVHMCIFKNQLCIRDMRHCSMPHPILFVFTREQVEIGLESHVWDKVAAIVTEYERKYKLWRNPK